MRIALPVKLAYTAFLAVLLPVYAYHYGPTNFLYFCDIALLLTLVGIWREDALLISMCAVGILAPQALWVADFLGNCAGIHLTGMTDYMFNAQSPLFLRGLSFFHGWLPFLLVYLVWRVGYDRRAFARWTGLAWCVLLVCFFFMPGPRPNPGLTPVNINYVYGMSDTAAQTWMSAWAWFGLLLVALPVVLLAPVHFVLRRWMPAAVPRRTGTSERVVAWQFRWPQPVVGA